MNLPMAPYSPSGSIDTHPASSPRSSESGSMLIELLIAMTFLTLAVGALIAVFSSSLLSLRHASIEGNALTLADKQMEAFRTLPYTSLGINTSTLPSSSDAYVTSPPSNLTSGQQASILTGQVNVGSIPATQTVTGPDGRSYRIDAYVYATGSAGNYQAYVQITIGVRSIVAGAIGRVRAQTTSAFDPASTVPPPS